MEFFGIGAWEILLIGLIALTIFGPKQLILMARKAGGYTRKFQLMWQENMKVLEDEVRAIENEVTDVKKEFENVGAELQKETNQIGSQMQENVTQINQTVTENTTTPSDAATAPQVDQPASPESSATPDTPAPASLAIGGDTPQNSPTPAHYPAWTESPKQ
ncbi:MAG: twin-arginine translocase TatA/TatE family subunit [Chloroflexi bacterium]|nr:twin-arginine translocase TatA/TatE family subunit [Chloroflexota bacterium]MBI5053805.1 twin-arginine translocase TatA/TatE family subunit [Chloroflexota bacterium]MBI5349941.1 twin-arginine translocase TatA/TatE family subunit [Chloroflexota bacterium]MBI5712939.1 twin-arginine translocase TatA/TatE family subunit [Chloroflexota bacterium]